MSDTLIIITILALFGLGIIPVLKLGEFMDRRHRYISEPKRDPNKRRDESDPVRKFERTGVLYTEDEDE